MIDLNGKVMLITGGSRGIGAATGLLAARAGADVAIVFQRNVREARRIEKAIQEEGGRSRCYKADVSSRSDVRKTVRAVVKDFGRIDILVNSAGIWTSGSLGSMKESVWDQTIDINLKGTWLLCNEVFPHMKRHGGKIINIASTAGQRGEAFHSHYAASKGGVIAFTRSIAVELAPYNVQVNCVSPGWVDTDMVEGALRGRSVRRDIERAIPRRRVATAEEVAGPILFLASSLSDHMIGSVVSVNGGSVMA
ncbi:MAG: SDR family NAD(P)-dependent oxidoreductase [Bacteroidota bacterium]